MEKNELVELEVILKEKLGARYLSLHFTLKVKSNLTLTFVSVVWGFCRPSRSQKSIACSFFFIQRFSEFKRCQY